MDQNGDLWILDLLAWGCVIYIQDYIYEAEEFMRVHTWPGVEWCNIPYLNMFQGMYAKGTKLTIVDLNWNKSPDIDSSC